MVTEREILDILLDQMVEEFKGGIPIKDGDVYKTDYGLVRIKVRGHYVSLELVEV